MTPRAKIMLSLLLAFVSIAAIWIGCWASHVGADWMQFPIFMTGALLGIGPCFLIAFIWIEIK